MFLSDYILERVSADIRQQMAGVLALSERLVRQRLTPDALACVEGITEAAASVRRMLDAARDIRKLDAQGLLLNPSATHLHDLMNDVQERWREVASASGVTLLISYDGDPEAQVVGDKDRLLQLFDGFVGEAVAGATRGVVEASLRVVATPDGVRLEGRVRSPGDTAWEAKDLKARVSEVDSRFGLEVALGLLLARRIVVELGGQINEEANRGGGQTLAFDLTLPAAEAAAQERPTMERPAHVLVVDDNATNRMVAQALCEMFNCTCEEAGDGLEAIEVARVGRFDLILMDIKMPRMDGVAASRAIRSLPGPAGAVPIVALTANADPDDAALYLAAGMDGVVEKPMKPEHLLAVLQQALSVPAEESAAA